MDLPLPELDGVEHRFATVRGVRLHWAEAGSGEPVVLQHGWPQHWWMWRHLIPPLAERYRVICPDLRGFGWSDAPPRGYRKTELAADLVALLDELGLERVRLVGHDWGGYVGFLTCFDHPERIERFVAVSIPHPWPPLRPQLLLRGTYQLVLAAPVLGELGVRRLGFDRAALRLGRSHGSFSRAELDAYSAATRPHVTVQMYRTFLLHELLPSARDMRGRRLTTPTLLLIGERDPLRAGAGPGYERHADDMRVEEVAGAAHFLPEERPEEVLERTSLFLGAGTDR